MKFTIKGGMRGGKNNYIVLRNGLHIPKKSWAKWRDQVVAQLKEGKVDVYDSDRKLTVILEYYPKDRLRRDAPGIIDALWHCFERAGIVKDDFMFKNVVFVTKEQDKLNPRVEVQIL